MIAVAKREGGEIFLEENGLPICHYVISEEIARDLAMGINLIRILREKTKKFREQVEKEIRDEKTPLE